MAPACVSDEQPISAALALLIPADPALAPSGVQTPPCFAFFGVKHDEVMQASGGQVSMV